MNEISVETAQQLRLTPEEFEMIQAKLGRMPNFTELCAFSAMWSEHCSYKNSIKWLKTLPRNSEKMLVAAGEENAGLMDIGNGYGVVFKIESHNHPSALEPFQGAATGVGGIQRDIFTMGARPIAALNSLRFGNLQDKKTQHLLSGVVNGIGHYGNCFGVPTVAGEVYFDECYQTNPLVNAMSVGILKAKDMISATAKGVGNPVFYVGSATGKDGIGGASFASANITKESVQELPAVQVGDPFQEKKLLEACLELMETGVIVGMQDMGAAGIICSTAEMSAKGNVGMKIDLDKVPTRQQNMQAWELLLSESQERMLLVVEKGKEAIAEAVFQKWDLSVANVGTVTDTGILEFYKDNSLVAAIPAEALVLGGGAPQYDRAFATPTYFQAIQNFDIHTIKDISETELKTITYELLQLPNIASKRWIYNQYDSMVGAANLSTNAPSDAAVVWAKEAQKALAVTVDCNSRYVYANPNVGAQIAVAEAARNIVCSGAVPLGVTNCLNFGNPYNPEVYYQFAETIKGMKAACIRFDTPVTGGNVSFYNQHSEGAVFPTPTIGMVGIFENLEDKTPMNFQENEDIIILIGEQKNDINSSQYLAKLKNVEYSPAPYFSLEEEFEIQQIVHQLIRQRAINAAHDLSEGGLMIALLEMGFYNNLGFAVDAKTNDEIRKDAYWFGEAQSRIIVTTNPEKLEIVEHFLQANQTPYTILGKVTTEKISINNQDWGSIKVWKNAYDTAIEKILLS